MRHNEQRTNDVKNEGALSHTWITRYGNVSLTKIDGKLQIQLQHEGRVTNIPLYDVRGLPKTIAAQNDSVLYAYLVDTYLTISPLGKNSFSIHIMPRMRGGANIIDPSSEADKLWRNAIVPFEIDILRYPVGKNERQIILQAVDEWNAAETGFTLVPRVDEEDYLIFGEEDGVCYSHVGRQGGRQYIRCDLDGGGFSKRSIKHEIGHAVGFYHEHQRLDRDRYVTVRARYSFDYGKKGKPYGDYDFNSIMHYFFSNKLRVKPGVISSGSEFVGMQDRISEGDIVASNYLARFARKTSNRLSFAFFPSATKPASVLTQLVNRVNRAMQQNNYQAAQKYLLALIQEYGAITPKAKVAVWWNVYGVCWLRLGSFAEAAVGFSNALEHNNRLDIARDNLNLAQQHIESENACVIL